MAKAPDLRQDVQLGCNPTVVSASAIEFSVVSEDPYTFFAIELASINIADPPLKEFLATQTFKY
jgi:hypothetical protein